MSPDAQAKIKIQPDELMGGPAVDNSQVKK